MALLKEIETQYGCKAKYWKILSQVMDTSTYEFTINVALYIDKQARNNKKNPIDIYPFITQNEFATKTEMYAHLKTLAQFNGSSDDLD